LPGFEEFFRPKREDLFGEWDMAAERERRSRTMFAQESIRVEEVARELEAARAAVGSSVDVRRFVIEATSAYGGRASANGAVEFDLSETPQSVRDAMGLNGTTKLRARFELPVSDGEVCLSRTHPVVEGLAAHVMDTALDPLLPSVASRAGAIRTRLVARRTTVLLLRYRFHIRSTAGGSDEAPLLAEDTGLVAFEGSPANATWLDAETAERLLSAEPDANVNPEQAANYIRRIVAEFDAIRGQLDEFARQRGE